MGKEDNNEVFAPVILDGDGGNVITTLDSTEHLYDDHGDGGD